MYCGSCGRQVADGARFCPWCGAATSVAGEGGEKGPGQAPGYGQAPAQGAAPVSPGGGQGTGSTQGPAPAQGAGPTQGPAPKVPRTRRRLVLVLGIVAAVLLLALGACVLLGTLGSGDAEDEAAGSEGASEATDVVTTVAYYGSEDAVTVTSSTHIVLWDDDGEAIEEFDLYLADDETGEVTRYAVDGGGFTPEGLGIPAGTYAMAARDTDAGKMYSVPVLVVTDDGAADADETDATDDSAGEADASDDELTYDAELVLRPDPDATDDSEASDLAYLYSLYYDKVLEYQALYGEATVSEDGLAVSGVALVLLEDLDADGTSELVVVWCESADWDAARGVEVWGWDAEARALEHLCSEGLHHANDLQAVWVYGEGGAGAILTWQLVDDSTWTDYTLMAEDGELVLYVEEAPLNSDAFAYSRDGVAISEDDYYDAHQTLYHSADFVRYDLWVSYEDDDSYEAAQEVLAATEATIAELVDGMLGRTDAETDVDELLATYATETFDYLAGGTYEGSYEVCDEYYTYSYMDSVPDLPLSWCVADLDGDGSSELVVIRSEYASNENSAYGEWYDAIVTVYEVAEGTVTQAATYTLEDAVVPAMEQVSAQWGVYELGGETYLAWELWECSGYLSDGVGVGFYALSYDGTSLTLAASAYVVGSDFSAEVDGEWVDYYSSSFEELFEALGVDGSFEDLICRNATILGDYLGAETFCTVTSELVVEHEDYASWRDTAGEDESLVVTTITVTGQGD